MRILIGLLTLVLFLFLLHAGMTPFGWCDMFWQVKVGEWVWKFKGVPEVDPFAWTTVGKEWVEHEWLTGLFFYTLHSLGGLLGLRLFFAALWVTGMAALYARLCKLYSDRALALLVVLVALGLFKRQFIPTPSTISLFLTFAFFLIISPWREEMSKRRIAFAIAVIYLWSCGHSQSMLMFGFMGFYAFVPIAQAMLAKVFRAPLTSPPIRPRLVLFFGSLAASFLTPYGYKVHGYALQGPWIARVIDEWQPLTKTDYVNAYPKLLFVFILLFFISSVVRRVRIVGWRGWLLSREILFDVSSIFCLWLSLKHGRFIWSASVPLIWSVRDWLPAWRTVRPSVAGALATAVLVVTFYQYGWSPLAARELATPDFFKRNLRSAMLPVGAADYLLSHPLEGNLFNHYVWGGYLIYRLHPHYEVFVDGRTVLHGAEIIYDELKISNGSPETMALLDKYDIRILVVGPYYFNEETAKKLGWRTMYKDSASAVYSRGGERKNK